MNFSRGSGVLLHISSLPSPYGIGDFGPGALRFADFLQDAGQTYWQFLPLSPTKPVYGNSPYSSESAFAINPLFISPDLLIADGWLNPEDVFPVPEWPCGRVDYDAAYLYKKVLFDKAFARFRQRLQDRAAYEGFCAENSSWLPQFAEFEVLKAHFSGAVWNRWPDDYKFRRESVLAPFRIKYQEQLERVKFLQFIARVQWQALRTYCAERSIRFIGDIPIYVNFDSADVWSYPGIFKMDETCAPEFVAGVPPDYFSETGQRWGNPVYDWQKLKEDDFGWWIARIAYKLKFFDFVRVDHFRGFVGFWQIPVAEKTAVNGEWIPVPVYDFFDKVSRTFSPLPIIAEDLGVITDDVKEVMAHYGFPGMKIFCFAFWDDIKTNPYIPENYPENCVAYTGTHDNNTVQGWYAQDVTEEEKVNMRQYFKVIDVPHLHWRMIDILMDSKAQVVIIPMQDYLGLGPEARMNKPATASGNWEWRVLHEQLTKDLAAQAASRVNRSGRNPAPGLRSLLQY